MTIMRIVYINCDVQGDSCGWGPEAMEGDPNQTATDLLRGAGWVTRNGKHICPQCQHPELGGYAHPKQMQS